MRAILKRLLEDGFRMDARPGSTRNEKGGRNEVHIAWV